MLLGPGKRRVPFVVALLGALAAGCNGWPDAAPPKSVWQPRPPPEKLPITFAVDLADPEVPLQEKASAVLEGRCGSCHGTPPPCCMRDGLSYIGDLERMVETGKIIPCHWTESRMFLRIARGEMPPGYANLDPPTSEELGFVADFVDGPLCDDVASGGMASGDPVSAP